MFLVPFIMHQIHLNCRKVLAEIMTAATVCAVCQVMFCCSRRAILLLAGVLEGDHVYCSPLQTNRSSSHATACSDSPRWLVMEPGGFSLVQRQSKRSHQWMLLLHVTREKPLQRGQLDGIWREAQPCWVMVLIPGNFARVTTGKTDCLLSWVDFCVSAHLSLVPLYISWLEQQQTL